MNLTVTGLGYLGLVHAACLADSGHHVLAMDIDGDKVARIEKGEIPFHEPGLAGFVQDSVAKGRLGFTTSAQEVARFSDVHFLCVGTPESPSGDADMSHLCDAIEALRPHLAHGSLVIGKSTTPPGQAFAISDWLKESGAEVAWNPEFLREGAAIWDTLNPERLVFGVSSPKAESVLRQVYRVQIASGVPVVVTDLTTAELAKLAANAFLATKISFINGLAQLCAASGGDVRVIAQALGHDSRIGVMKPGIGFGGGCLPKDLHSLKAVCQDHGAHRFARLLSYVDNINIWRREEVIILAGKLLGINQDFTGKKITILGIAFKPGTDDVRESPGLYIAHALAAGGARITIHDPVAKTSEFACEDSPDKAIEGADLVILATEWPGYDAITPGTPGKIIDGRYALDRAKWESAGWEYHEAGI